jgi:serine/threonine protein kinase
VCAARYSRCVAARRWGNRWERVNDIGQGGQAHTFMVRDLQDGSTGWVLKRLKNPKRLDLFEREIRALDRLTSTNIPAVVDYAVSTEQGKSYLVTRYVGTDLTMLPDVIEPELLLQRFRGIVVAVHDAHAKGVIHRDIKPNNATVDAEGTPYLVDFGICAMDEESQVELTTTMEAFGNRSFAAPECDAGSVDEAREPSDVYSLGKLLYWMASGKKVFSREDFDRNRLTIADPHAHQYISVLIDHTVRENPGARSTVTELLEGIDWALAKLREHAALKQSGLVVLADGFGPNNQCYENGFFSAATAPQGNPPGDHDIAESFFVSERVVLDRLDIGVWCLHGSGRAKVTLIKGGDEVPSNDVVEEWDVDIPHRLAVLELQSVSLPTLGPSEVYWVVVFPTDNNSHIGWFGSAIELAPRLSRAAQRIRPQDWEPRVSIRGPGSSLRVLAQPT